MAGRGVIERGRQYANSGDRRDESCYTRSHAAAVHDASRLWGTDRRSHLDAFIPFDFDEIDAIGLSVQNYHILFTLRILNTSFNGPRTLIPLRFRPLGRFDRPRRREKVDRIRVRRSYGC